jgi:hypothetical protein
MENKEMALDRGHRGEHFGVMLNLEFPHIQGSL